MSLSVNPTPPGGGYTDPSTFPLQKPVLNIAPAETAYCQATENPKSCHVEVGILRPTTSESLVVEPRIGKDEPYGAHRVGSVTKTFTTFLALKLSNDHIKLKNDSLFGLNTKLSELVDPNTLKSIFADPDAAAQMTLEQLLSHTSGLEYDDHNREEPGLDFKTIDARFRHEGTVGNKYKHTSQPGDHIGSYSNAGLAVASWMMEIAYNLNLKNTEVVVPFSQIIKKELFDEVFKLSQDTFIAPGPTGDVIGSAAGDMTSSVQDLLQVAEHLQQGEEHLAGYFGPNWHQTMLAPRDLFEHHGLGCSANESSIQHAGLNSEIFEDDKRRDVTALVIFPLGKDKPGLVAMCDSNALGPLPNQTAFANELRKLAEMDVVPEKTPKYELDFFCPSSDTAMAFKGDAYVVTDLNPFSTPPPDKISLSRNGMKHELKRDASIDAKDAAGYRDVNGKKWMVISKGERKMIYSDYCLVSQTSEIKVLTQPTLDKVKALEGKYYDAKDDLTYHFFEKGGHLYFQEGTDKPCPALYLPEENFWVVSLPEGRKNIKFRFQDDPKNNPLIIVDISKKITDPTAPIPEAEIQPPKGSYKKE